MDQALYQRSTRPYPQWTTHEERELNPAPYQHRFYREWVRDQSLHRFHITIAESDLLILTDRGSRDEAIATLRRVRQGIERIIEAEPLMAGALEPLEAPLPKGATPVVSTMVQSARFWGVGPLAAVAGAVAQAVGQQLLASGATTVIVENGGDIFARTAEPLCLTLYAGEKSAFSQSIIFEVDASQGIGVCTSSGTVGPSLSFGQADAVVAIAADTAFADAAATAIANQIQSPADVAPVVERQRKRGALCGLLACCGDRLGLFGQLRLVPSSKLRHDEQLCVHCTACVGACASGAFAVDEATATVRHIPHNCSGCRACVDACSYDALSTLDGIFDAPGELDHG